MYVARAWGWYAMIWDVRRSVISRRQRSVANQYLPKFLNACESWRGSETTLFFSSSYRTSVYPCVVMSDVGI